MTANGDSSGWKWIRLGDHATKIGSGFTPTGGHKSYRDSGIPLIRSQYVHMNRFAPEGLALISPEQDEEMIGSRVLSGDVLLNIRGLRLAEFASCHRMFAQPT